jgi:hypothetical protein
MYVHSYIVFVYGFQIHYFVNIHVHISILLQTMSRRGRPYVKLYPAAMAILDLESINIFRRLSKEHST